MKRIIFLVAAAHMAANAFSQVCTANAGPDRTVCVGPGNSQGVQLGGTPAVTGGVKPFTYVWQGSYTVSSGQSTIVYPASYFLSDTSTANPVTTGSQGEYMTFVLTVTDSMNAQCSDTVRIRYSVAAATMGYGTYHIAKGDTVKCSFPPNISGGIAPVQYIWRPQHGLIDSTNNQYLITSPQQSTSYSLTVMDAAGCVFTGAACHVVNVSATGLSEPNGHATVSVFPNPATGQMNVSVYGKQFQSLNLMIYDLAGRNVFTGRLSKNKSDIDLTGLAPGLYQVLVAEKENVIWRERVVIR